MNVQVSRGLAKSDTVLAYLAHVLGICRWNMVQTSLLVIYIMDINPVLFPVCVFFSCMFLLLINKFHLYKGWSSHA